MNNCRRIAFPLSYWSHSIHTFKETKLKLLFYYYIFYLLSSDSSFYTINYRWLNEAWGGINIHILFCTKLSPVSSSHYLVQTTWLLPWQRPDDSTHWSWKLNVVPMKVSVTSQDSRSPTCFHRIRRQLLSSFFDVVSKCEIIAPELGELSLLTLVVVQEGLFQRLEAGPTLCKLKKVNSQILSECAVHFQNLPLAICPSATWKGLPKENPCTRTRLFEKKKDDWPKTLQVEHRLSLPIFTSAKCGANSWTTLISQVSLRCRIYGSNFSYQSMTEYASHGDKML